MNFFLLHADSHMDIYFMHKIKKSVFKCPETIKLSVSCSFKNSQSKEVMLVKFQFAYVFHAES